eukprot:TRINITY_DN20605_c0_g1_i1.p1 TRINITY_DN20605_c0_g1~~TRINITY_DN20605_c0_g1_i1.p1  ORF type:complete len:113 (+),score=18.14 TRINITY_DN20605_c0_g1_i1:65-403(+)
MTSKRRSKQSSPPPSPSPSPSLSRKRSLSGRAPSEDSLRRRHEEPTTARDERPVIASMDDFAEKVVLKIREVPPGALTTYGRVAEALGSKRVARHVGWVLASCGPVVAGAER